MRIPSLASAMMTGQNIICFAKDFSEVPTSNNHVMAELAKHNRVLWLNSVATRRPRLGSARDLRKIFTKLASITRPLRKVRDNFWVHTPLVLPLPHNRLAQAVNRRILCAVVSLLRRRLKMQQFQLWTFLPNTADYFGRLGESLAVYYCVDDWAGFKFLDRQRTADAERELCRRVDVVFATAQSLADGRRALNPQTYVARHGVDHALFASALEASTEVPPDVARLPKPVIGFCGTISDWVDCDLVAYLAKRHPDWSFALIGDMRTDITRLQPHRNIHLLPRRPHEELPGCCKGFAVGIIPYRIDEQVLHVNPIKLREYLSAGLPVVSTPIPEVARLGEHCRVASDREQFERAIEQALRGDSPEQRRGRSNAMRDETWEHRVRELGDRVMQVKAKRGQP